MSYEIGDRVLVDCGDGYNPIDGVITAISEDKRWYKIDFSPMVISIRHALEQEKFLKVSKEWLSADSVLQKVDNKKKPWYTRIFSR